MKRYSDGSGGNGGYPNGPHSPGRLWKRIRVSYNWSYSFHTSQWYNLFFIFVLHIELIQIKKSEKFTFVIIIWWCSHQPTTIATVAWAVSTLFLVIEYANVNLSVNVSNLYGNVCLSIDFPLGSQCPTHPTSSHNHCLVPTLFCFCLLLFVFLGNLAILYCP